MNKTKMLKKSDTMHDWYVIDVEDKVLGRAASRIATVLMGKHRPDFTQHVDSGGGVIVLNCDKLRITGNKEKQKVYTSYSGYPGGLKKVTFEKMHAKKPKYILRHAVRGMLPKTRIGVRMLRRLKLYQGKEHPHIAQRPVVITF